MCRISGRRATGPRGSRARQAPLWLRGLPTAGRMPPVPPLPGQVCGEPASRCGQGSAAALWPRPRLWGEGSGPLCPPSGTPSPRPAALLLCPHPRAPRGRSLALSSSLRPAPWRQPLSRGFRMVPCTPHHEGPKSGPVMLPPLPASKSASHGTLRPPPIGPLRGRSSRGEGEGWRPPGARGAGLGPG